MDRRQHIIRSLILLLTLIVLCGCTATEEPEKENLLPTPEPVSGKAPVVVVEEIATMTPAASVTPIPTPTPTPSPTPTPTPTPTPSPTPTPLGLLPWTEGERFSPDQTVYTDSEYKSANVSITFRRVSDDNRTKNTLVYFVADIYLTNVESFRRGQSMGSFGKSHEPIAELAKRYGAIVAMSGDHCEKGDKALTVVDGNVVYDGKRYRYDMCVLYKDGTIEMIPAKEINREAVLAKDPWQTWNFGPILYNTDGSVPKKYNLPDSIDGKNPRAVLGYYGPGHYCFVLVDGRQKGYSVGLTLKELTELMQDLGCISAYNLDGGVSAQITWNGKRMNSPGKNRSICDILYIIEPPVTEADPAPAGETAETAENNAEADIPAEESETPDTVE